MPKGVSEISDGNQFSRSSEAGAVADSAVRTFRIILNSPSETFDIQSSCGVFIGDLHPVNPNIACVSFSSQYENNSRTVLTATFNYKSEAAASAQFSGGGGGGSPKSLEPFNRPSNWTIDAETSEFPVSQWRRRTSANTWDSSATPPVNPAGDLYEGLTFFMPLTTITVSQFVIGTSDPTIHSRFVGHINSDQLRIGSLTILPHELMLKNVSVRPVMESHGSIVYRGYNVDYKFLHRVNYASVSLTEGIGSWPGYTEIPIGWDIAVPVEGRNVLAFNPAAANAWEDPYGQPLKMEDGLVASPLALASGVTAGTRQRAHVRIAASDGNGSSLAAASAPVALNANGTPRLVSNLLPPIVWAYQIYPEIPMLETLQLRLY